MSDLDACRLAFKACRKLVDYGQADLHAIDDRGEAMLDKVIWMASKACRKGERDISMAAVLQANDRLLDMARRVAKWLDGEGGALMPGTLQNRVRDCAERRRLSAEAFAS